MNWQIFFRRVARGLELLWQHAVWPTAKAVVVFLWGCSTAILTPIAQGMGKAAGTATPYLLAAGVVVGGLYSLLLAPPAIQEQGVAIVALFVFCAMVWFAFWPSKPNTRPHHGRKRR